MGERTGETSVAMAISLQMTFLKFVIQISVIRDKCDNFIVIGKLNSAQKIMWHVPISITFD